MFSSFDYGQTAPVKQESNGWLLLSGIGPKFTPGWVSAKFCTVGVAGKLTEAELQRNDNVRVWKVGNDIYAAYGEFDEMNG